MPLCPLWVGPDRVSNSEVENHFRRVKSNKLSGPKCAIDDFVLARYRDLKYLITSSVRVDFLFQP